MLPTTGEELKRERKARGLTQEQAAGLAWVSTRNWQGLEHCKDLSNSMGRVELFILKSKRSEAEVISEAQSILGDKTTQTRVLLKKLYDAGMLK